MYVKQPSYHTHLTYLCGNGHAVYLTSSISVIHGQSSAPLVITCILKCHPLLERPTLPKLVPYNKKKCVFQACALGYTVYGMYCSRLRSLLIHSDEGVEFCSPSLCTVFHT